MTIMSMFSDVLRGVFAACGGRAVARIVLAPPPPFEQRVGGKGRLAHGGASVRAWIALVLAAVLLGGAGEVRAQNLSNLVMTDPHGNTVPFDSPFSPSQAYFVTVTFPYVFLTPTLADQSLTLQFKMGDASSVPLIPATNGMKVRVDLSIGLNSPLFHVTDDTGGRDYTTFITRTSGGIPADPTLTATPGPGNVALSWVAPTDTGGADITGYKVRWATMAAPTTYLNAGAAAGADVSGGASATTYTIPSLAGGTTYGAQVAAVNSHGTGGWSAAQNSAPVLVPTPPTAPQSVNSAISSETLTLSWQAPADNGGAAITDYKVRWAQGAGSDTWINTPGGSAGESSGAGDLMHSITGLTNGTTYEVQVAAVNSAGTGTWSPSHRNNPAQPPQAAPGNLRVQGGAGLLMLSWTAPSDDGGDAITGYAVRWAEGNDSSVWANPPGDGGRATDSPATGPPATTYTLTGLQSSTTYEVQVAARNDAGTGMWSSASVEGVTSAFSVDIDNSGTVDSIDALLIARYLTGLRGAALVANLAESMMPAAVAAKINAGVLAGVLDIDGANGTTAADGIMLARYHLGVTSGAALTAGMSSAMPAKVIENITNLPMP